MSLSSLLWIMLVTPLAASLAIAFGFRRNAGVAVPLSLGAAGLILVVAAMAIFGRGEQTIVTSVPWLVLGDFELNFSFLFDGLAAAMLAVVAFVAFWIHLFSVGYMADDLAKPRFFGGLSFFMFSILGIVLSGNLFMTFVFWELVGFSSYLLIAHYWDREEAAYASLKAFVANRIGDLGFLVGIVWAYQYYGTADFAELQAIIESGGAEKLTGLGLCLICGFIGKSAQFPLQVWLTDAMAGPTPVSALIHAATMVAAGIFLLARIFFLLTPEVVNVILGLGTAMVFLAGFWALGQRDIKKTLAYSTLSHLGYMAVAVGLNMPLLAMAHLAMHACFKATLFLCAGSVIHACHHEQDMFKMGGLRRKMPITFGAFVVAGLSNCALWPLAGWFSKDAIIGESLAQGLLLKDHAYDFVVFAMVLIGALATTLYMGRMAFTVFFGQPNSPAASHANESGRWMTIPLIVLGACSALAGLAVHYDLVPPITHLLELGIHKANHDIHEAHVHWPVVLAGHAILVLGLVATWFFYGRGAKEDALAKRAPGVYAVLERHGWFDDAYHWLTKRVHDRLAQIIAFTDFALVSLAGVQGTSGLVRFTGAVLRSLQNGSLHGYVFWFTLGILFYLAFAFGVFS